MDVDCGSGWNESNSANFENYFKRSSIRFQNYFKIRLYAKPHMVIATPMKTIKLAKIDCSYYLLVIVCLLTGSRKCRKQVILCMNCSCDGKQVSLGYKIKICRHNV